MRISSRRPRRRAPHGRLHARDVALVVGAPDVDDAVEAAPEELVVVVGDVARRSRSGRRCERTRTLSFSSPRALLLSQTAPSFSTIGALVAQQLHRLRVDAAVLVEGRFEEPHVVVHVHRREVVADAVRSSARRRSAAARAAARRR